MCRVCIPVGPPQTRAVASASKVWKDRNVLRVAFLEGDDSLHNLVMNIASMISHYCDMRFEKVPKGSKSEVRISFQNSGSWSYVGTDNLLILDDQPTMNYGWLSSDMDSNSPTATSVVLHEFGHAVGLQHEQGHPHQNIPWDFNKVFRWFEEKYGWTEDQVRQTYMNRMSIEESNFNAYDRASIMHYPIDNEWTIGDWEIPWITQLSSSDKEFLHSLYPFNNNVYLPSVKNG